ncbi:E3 ubiquitin-protein ligase DZIP3-like [Clytia hemisphaerica]|uniref:E3 ubiquitin-protein ligase DZIP3-like n=1 Tax=Clytia hemisphaerica TaxID=252671 RepID=UPI0034D4FD83
MATSQYTSVADAINKLQYYLRLVTFEQEPLKEGLLHVFHNKDGDQSYIGLPEDPKALYHEFSTTHLQTLQRLKRQKVIDKAQYDLLLPPNSNETDSEKFDVTLLVILIAECTTLPAPATGWRRIPPETDFCKGAFVIRGREWRNGINHPEDIKNMKEPEFEQRWGDGCDIIQGLCYTTYNTNYLKHISLDQRLPVVLQALQNYVASLKPDLDQQQDRITDLRQDVNKLVVDQSQHNQSLADLRNHVDSEIEKQNQASEKINQVMEDRKDEQVQQMQKVASLQQNISVLSNKQRVNEEAIGKLGKECLAVKTLQEDQKYDLDEVKIEIVTKLECDLEATRDELRASFPTQKEVVAWMENKLTSQIEHITLVQNAKSRVTSMNDDDDYCLEEVRRMIIENLGDQLDDFLTRLDLPNTKKDDAMFSIKNIPWTQLKRTIERIGKTALVEEIQRTTLVTEGISSASERIRNQLLDQLIQCLVHQPFSLSGSTSCSVP